MAKMPAGLKRYWATHRRGGKVARRRNTMKNGRRTSRKKSLTIPLAVVAGLIPGGMSIYAHRGTGIEGMAAEASRIYLGYASTNQYGYNDTIGFHPYLLRYGLLPIAVGGLIHKFIGGTLGINRMLAQAGIPLLRI